MNYFELLFTTITTEDYQQDLLIGALGEIGFNTFEEVDFGFKAYIPSVDFDQAQLDTCLSAYHNLFSFNYETTLIPGKNWNEVWESNFEPITISNKIYVRATFHPPKPQYPHEIIIDPKMAFGTGHHQTTAMMLGYMLEENFTGKKVLDMGCGTGILAIMAAKLGADRIIAIDNDPICCESTVENSNLNQVTNINVLCGSKEMIPTIKVNVILANINRNILIDQLESYSGVLQTGGTLYVSGFYENPDLSIFMVEALKYGFIYQSHKTDRNWIAVKLVC